MLRKRLILTFLFSLQVILSLNNAVLAKEFVSLETRDTHSRITLQIDDGVKHRVKNTKNGLEIKILGLTLFDIGAPLGAQKQWAKRFNNLKDNRVKNIRLSELNHDVIIKADWNFPEGDDQYAFPKMDIFDYRKNNPNEYAIDFWYKDGLTVSEYRKNRKTKNQKKESLLSKNKRKKRQERKIASVKKKEVALRLNSHCDSPLSELNTIFVPFKTVHSKIDLTSWINVITADVNYRYKIPNGKSRLDQYIRLIHNLYDQSKFGLVLKSINFLNDEFPENKYNKEMKFLTANVFIRMGYEIKAEEMFNEIISLHEKDKPSYYSSLYLAVKSYNKGEHAKSFDLFNWLIRKYPKNEKKWLFHLGLAESYYYMGNTERAMKEYLWIIKNTNEEKIKEKIALKLGDIYLSKRQYELAIATYHKSKIYTDNNKTEEVYLNKGESFYWIGDYDKSRKIFEEFKLKYPSHAEGWRASFRLGEIYGRRDDKTSLKKSKKWFYNTINKHPDSVGATMARLMLASCNSNSGFNSFSLRKLYNEDVQRKKNSKSIDKVSFEKFTDLHYAKGLVSLNENSDALEFVSKKISNKTYRNKLLNNTFNIVFRKNIIDKIENKDGFGAIYFYEKYHKYLSDNFGYVDKEYLIKLSSMALELNLVNYSEKITEHYSKIKFDNSLNRSIAGDNYDLEKITLKSLEGLNLAKQLWFKHGMKKESKIQELLKNISNEYVLSYEKEALLSIIYSKKENKILALRHAINAKNLIGKSDINLLNNINYWIYLISSKMSQYSYARDSLSSVINHYSLEVNMNNLIIMGLPKLPDILSLKVEIGALYEKAKKENEAINIYTEVIESEDFDKNKNLKNRVYFRLAKLLKNTEEKENIKKADKLINKINTQGNKSFWRELAAEELAQTN